jgi:hypothetical protein
VQGRLPFPPPRSGGAVCLLLSQAAAVTVGRHASGASEAAETQTWRGFSPCLEIMGITRHRCRPFPFHEDELLDEPASQWVRRSGVGARPLAAEAGWSREPGFFAWRPTAAAAAPRIRLCLQGFSRGLVGGRRRRLGQISGWLRPEGRRRRGRTPARLGQSGFVRFAELHRPNRAYLYMLMV